MLVVTEVSLNPADQPVFLRWRRPIAGPAATDGPAAIAARVAKQTGQHIDGTARNTARRSSTKRAAALFCRAPAFPAFFVCKRRQVGDHTHCASHGAGHDAVLVVDTDAQCTTDSSDADACPSAFAWCVREMPARRSGRRFLILG